MGNNDSDSVMNTPYYRCLTCKDEEWQERGDADDHIIAKYKVLQEVHIIGIISDTFSVRDVMQVGVKDR